MGQTLTSGPDRLSYQWSGVDFYPLANPIIFFVENLLTLVSLTVNSKLFPPVHWNGIAYH